MPGGEEGLADRVHWLLSRTDNLVLALGVLNIWNHPPPVAKEVYEETSRLSQGRLLVGLGVGHEPLLAPESPGHGRRPIESMQHYLDRLGEPQFHIPREHLFLAALGPGMMRIAADRTAGAHPYLVTPAHTLQARKAVGPHALLAPEQHVVLDVHPDGARATARRYMATYFGLPNYVASFRRMGFTTEDFAAGGSDRMVDALVAWGEPEQIVDRVDAHLAAGADHVAIQVLTSDRMAFPVEPWRALSAALQRRGHL